jgi:Predicted ATPase/kinase involved in NAD metabolism
MFGTKQDTSTIKKVCVIGPECTGKSELSQFLSKHYKSPCVDEYARAYLNKLGRPYEKFDLTKIAHGQLRMEDVWMSEAKRLLICDTNLMVIKIWSEHKFGDCDKEILQKMGERKYDLFLLTYIDIPWQEDPQREHPDKREHFWYLFKNEIEKTGTPFVEIAGPREERRKKSIEAIDALLK